MNTALQITIAEYDRLIKKGFFDQFRDRLRCASEGERGQNSSPGASALADAAGY